MKADRRPVPRRDNRASRGRNASSMLFAFERSGAGDRAHVLAVPEDQQLRNAALAPAADSTESRFRSAEQPAKGLRRPIWPLSNGRAFDLGAYRGVT